MHVPMTHINPISKWLFLIESIILSEQYGILSSAIIWLNAHNDTWPFI